MTGEGLDLEVLGGAAADVCILFTATSSVKALARRVHGLRRGRPGRFRALNCGWAESLLEELLVHALRPGSSGTVFLEEVGRLSLGFQQRLLEILDTPIPAGGSRKTRARVMASTSEPLVQRVVEGTFNQRLLYRLNAIHVVVPPDLGDF
jgi:transcriptional regulator of acetoin/glycerol metabolism